jgi:hypothetical protein
VAGAGHQGFVDDQLPLAVVEVGIQGVVALGNGEAIQVEVGVGVQNRGAPAPLKMWRPLTDGAW